jgi:hypothetical protein
MAPGQYNLDGVTSQVCAKSVVWYLNIETDRINQCRLERAVAQTQ